MNFYFPFLISGALAYISSSNCPHNSGFLLHPVTAPVDHGEGPTWDERTQLLYYVDLHAGKIYSYDPVTYKQNHVTLPGDVTPVIPSKHDPFFFVAGLNRSIIALKWNSRNDSDCEWDILTTVAAEYPTSRFNDGKADARGRLWIGTMGYEDAKGVAPNQGALYEVTKANIEKPEKVISPVNISNGLAWNKANDKFFYIDTPTRKVLAYNFDLNSGRIWNPECVFDLAEHDDIAGVPDGMTIDDEDNLWIALYDGGAVVKVDPRTRKILKVIPIPAQYVTSVAWGGENLDVLFVTTSRNALSKEDRKKQPAAGSLFAVYNLGTRGLNSYKADIIDEEKMPCFA